MTVKPGLAEPLRFEAVILAKPESLSLVLLLRLFSGLRLSSPISRSPDKNEQQPLRKFLLRQNDGFRSWSVAPELTWSRHVLSNYCVA